jgi:glycosyltransferase involved in cell wall biosynthesis
VVTDDDRRGAQVFAVVLGEHLTELGAEVETVALCHGEAGGLSLPVLGDRSLGCRTLTALRRRMATVDVTVAHGSRTLPACATAGLGPGRPFVYRQVSDPMQWAASRGQRARTWAYYRTPAHVVALTDRTARAVQAGFGVGADQITTIPNAVDARRWPAANPSERADARVRFGLPAAPASVVGYVGALVREKGVDDLVASVPSEATLLLAGAGPARAELEAAAARRGVRASFAGVVEDPWHVYAAADVLCLPSHTESQPAVLLEAAMVGTAVVATHVGDIPTVVRDGVTGLLVPPGDPAALRAALADLLSDPPRRAAQGAAGRDLVETTMTFEVVAPRWHAVLEAVVRAR